MAGELLGGGGRSKRASVDLLRNDTGGFGRDSGCIKKERGVVCK